MPFVNGVYVMGAGASSSKLPAVEQRAQPVEARPLPPLHARDEDVSAVERMNKIISCWSLAEKRAKHLCAFETLGLDFRVRKPSKEEVKRAWQRLCVKLHPDRNTECNELATEATRCINLAKQHLFEVHFGCVDSAPGTGCGTPYSKAACKSTHARKKGQAAARGGWSVWLMLSRFDSRTHPPQRSCGASGVEARGRPGRSTGARGSREAGSSGGG